MKKYLVCIILAISALVFCACGSNDTPAATPTPIIIYVTPEPAPTPTPIIVYVTPKPTSALKYYYVTPEPTTASEPTQAPEYVYVTPEPTDKAERQKDTYEVGDSLMFGKYEQDNVKTNGAEDIEWLVMDRRDGKYLLVSKYILDKKTFDSDQWSKSPLRKWLNNDFIKDSFSDAEAAMIQKTTVSADLNQMYITVDPGKNTEDKVFLLSIDEVNAYFGDTGVGCEPTEYALANRVYCKFDDYGNWWLRTPGNTAGFMAYVTHDPEVSPYGAASNTGGVGIRPAMWVKFD